jgi:protein TonB
MILPLFLTQAIDPHKLELTYLVAPPLAPGPLPPPATAAPQRPTSKRVMPVTAKLTMPIAIPKIIPNTTDNEAAEAPPDVLARFAGGVTGGVPDGQIGGLLGGILGGTAASPSPPQPVAASPAPSEPLHLRGEVKLPRKIYAPAPQYPILAQQAMIKGVVEIDAVIDKDGNVVEERPISGPALLIAAALEAVKHWKYQPTYLNGVPWPIELTIDVTFSLS